MEIKSIKPIGKQQVYDLTIEDAEHYVLENGVVTHNTGIYYSANQIFMIGRSQDKGDDGLEGYNFTINIDKSRFVKEKSKLQFNVNFDSGVNKWSGLMDLALESGHCVKPKNGWYARKGEDKNWRLDATNSSEFWLPILKDDTFQEYVRTKFQLAHREMFQFEEDEELV